MRLQSLVIVASERPARGLGGAGPEQPFVRAEIWTCPAAQSGALRDVEQARQFADPYTNALPVRYWMWRFDRPADPVPRDNFWGRSETECVTALREANNPQAGQPGGVHVLNV
jgi:hypothetical protein